MDPAAVTIMFCKPRKRKEIKGSGTPKDAGPQPPHLAMRLAPCKARSPDGVPPRFSPKGVIVPEAQLQARLPGTWSERALPAFACPRPASTSRPGHNAGRLMPKPPGRGQQVRPRAPPSLLWPGMPPDHVLHVSEDAHVTVTGTFVNRKATRYLASPAGGGYRALARQVGMCSL